jgi:2,4-dienoyl-CoA reductase-like NADH-dependent reductase (Old Yellow Enzyme family)
METVSKLFTPLRIGPLELRNRSIRAAAFEGMCPGNTVSQALIDYHSSVAEGGIGMTTVAYASVCRNGLSFPHQLWMRSEIIPDLRKLTDSVHRHGAAVAVQIGHCGNMSKKSVAGEWPVSADTGINIYSPTWARALKKNELQLMAKNFGQAVKLAREGGFDAVEVHAGHGYLISQFLSPYTNHRNDEFGGSLENRMRFMNMCMEEVMQAAGSDIAVIVKMNMDDGFKKGMHYPDTLEVARQLERTGVHAIVLSSGFVSKAPMVVMRGTMPIKTLTHYMDSFFLKTGVRMFGKMMIPAVPYKETYFFEDALKFRSALKVPLIYVGGVTSLESINKVLDAGFEGVAMARALLNEPGFIRRLQEGDFSKNGCTHSNYCIARMYSIEMACHTHTKDLPPFILNEIDQLKS